MIDWYTVAIATLWILGLAELLAVLSYAYWFCDLQDTSMRRVLSVPSFRLSVILGAMLFALGMLLTVEEWWEKVGWIGICMLLLWDGIAAWRDWHAMIRQERAFH